LGAAPNGLFLFGAQEQVIYLVRQGVAPVLLEKCLEGPAGVLLQTSGVACLLIQQAGEGGFS